MPAIRELLFKIEQRSFAIKSKFIYYWLRLMVH